jgi:hypothetical protein
MAGVTPTDDKSLPTILNKADFARLLNKSERTIDRLQRAGVLPEPLIPGHPRWSGTVVKLWLEGGTVSRRGRR